MKRFINAHKKALAAVAAGAIVAAGGAAYATASGWISPTGSGSGNATAWTAVASVPSNSTTAPGNVNATALYPGGPGVTGVVSITNPNPYPVVITNIDNNGGSALVNTNCVAGSVNATNQDASKAVPLTQTDNTTTAIGANSSGLYNVSYTMISTADNSCQGQTFVVALHVGAASANF